MAQNNSIPLVLDRNMASASTVAPRDSLAEVDAGAFKRTPSVFRDAVGGAEYPPEAGRYVLYVSRACPWANRCLAAIQLKGLAAVIRVVTCAPVWAATRPDDAADKHRGWVFDASIEGSDAVDPLFGAKSIRGVYAAAANGGGAAKFTVPLLVDALTLRIVNNESSEIVRMLNTAFNEWAEHPDVDLYPEHLRSEIDAHNTRIYEAINDGVYRCGFAQAQDKYDAAAALLFSTLDEYDALLAGRRFLCGDVLTEADVRFAMTLFRFDAVYVVYFKCNRRMIREYAHLHAYARDVFQYADGAIGRTIDM